MGHWIIMGIEEPFWRAIAVFRIVSVVYASVLLARAGGYSHPVTGWIVIGVMALWTAVTIYAYSAFRGRPLLVADLAVTLGCLLTTPVVQAVVGPMPITATWVAGPVLAWAVYGGRRAGAVAAAVMSAADLWLRGVRGFEPVSVPVNGAVLLFMAGVVVGHVASLAKQSEERMQRAIELEAIGRERERLARGIHDSVLQVLALVQRKGMEIGGEAAELGRLAGEQEAVLRELVRSGPHPEPGPAARRRISMRLTTPGRRVRGAALPTPGPAGGGTRARGWRWSSLGRSGGRRGEVDPDGFGARGQERPAVVDLCVRLRRHGTAFVTVSTPATPIPLVTAIAGEIAAAVGAALDNVRSHCGEEARAWILAEHEDDRVIVTVRDEGPGIPDGRLDEAAAAGRMGVARSIRGRIADLGGNVTITSSGAGTEIELMVPTSASAVRRARRASRP